MKFIKRGCRFDTLSVLLGKSAYDYEQDSFLRFLFYASLAMDVECKSVGVFWAFHNRFYDLSAIALRISSLLWVFLLGFGLMLRACSTIFATRTVLRNLVKQGILKAVGDKIVCLARPRVHISSE